MPDISKPTWAFFRSERANEANGGDTPSTLSSALDSLNQIATGDFHHDFGGKASDVEDEIRSLAEKYGWDRPLNDVMMGGEATLAEPTLCQIIDNLKESESSEGCSDDLTVVSRDAYNRLIRWRERNYHG